MIVDLQLYDPSIIQQWAAKYPLLNFELMLNVTGRYDMIDIFRVEEGVEWTDPEKLFAF